MSTLDKGLPPHIITELLLKAEKKYGKNVLYRAGDNPDAELPRISTGLASFDKIIGGGLVRGRLYEFYGPESGGKTSLALKVASQFPQVLFVDAEGTYTQDFGAIFGNTTNTIYVERPEYGEQAMQTMFDWAKEGVPLIILDSVPFLNPQAIAEKEATDAVKVAPVPLLLSNQLPRLVSVAGKSGTIIIFINQIRMKIGVIYGDPTDSPGGKALRHAVSLRIQVGRKEWITDDKLKEIGEEEFGQITKIRVQKSKISEPRRSAELPLIFHKGFVEHEEILDHVNALRVKAGFGKKRPRPVVKESA